MATLWARSKRLAASVVIPKLVHYQRPHLAGQIVNLRPIGNRHGLYSLIVEADFQLAAGCRPAPHEQRGRGAIAFRPLALHGDILRLRFQPAGSASHLQSAVRDSEPARSALQIAAFRLHGDTNGGLGCCLGDFFQAGARRECV